MSRSVQRIVIHQLRNTWWSWCVFLSAYVYLEVGSHALSVRLSAAMAGLAFGFQLVILTLTSASYRAIYGLPLSIRDQGRLQWWLNIGALGIFVTALNSVISLILTAPEFGHARLISFCYKTSSTWAILAMMQWMRVQMDRGDVRRGQSTSMWTVIVVAFWPALAGSELLAPLDFAPAQGSLSAYARSVLVIISVAGANLAALYYLKPELLGKWMSTQFANQSRQRAI